MGKDVIKIQNVWKIFGERAQEALDAVRKDNLGKGEVLEKFDCVVGVVDAAFSVDEGEIFCVMGLSGSGKSTLVGRGLRTAVDGRSRSVGTVLGVPAGRADRARANEPRAVG